MTYVLEIKALPGQDPAAPAPAPSPTPVGGDTPPRWAGDVYQEGDETSPEESQWAFTGDAGEQAWLDRTDDGTITGWVRDPDGTVYRYTDPDAWAVDVDDAGMARTGGDFELEDNPEDPAGDDGNAEPADDELTADPAAEDSLEQEPTDDASVDEEYPVDDEQLEDPAEEATESPEEESVEDDAEGDGDDEFKKRKFGATEGKTLRLVYAKA